MKITDMENPTSEEKSKVRKWMVAEEQSYTDGRTGEVNCTELAEAVAANFDIYLDDEATIPEWVFDLASEIGRP